MQVNSAQDYLTQYKRQVIGNSYIADPPAKAKNKSSYNYTIFVANRATQYNKFVGGACRGNQTCNTASMGRTFTSLCCVSSGAVLY
uniref:Uncharacterized protein n=1 Tax=viral metagenome TaxID=1070528 RepID=A0A6C0JLP1_9ZZZZ